MDYEYIIDRLVKVWQREYVTIDADSKESADKIAQMVGEGEKWLANKISTNILENTIVEMKPEENESRKTVAVMTDDTTGTTIWTNGE